VSESKNIFFLTELCENGSLYDRLYMNRNNNDQKRPGLSDREQWLFARGVARGVAYLHSKSIIHRDLKSANILLSVMNEVKICDFGLSKVAEYSQGLSSRQKGVGTFAWMAPEQFQDDEAGVVVDDDDDEPKYKVSAASDVWGLACILLEIFGGESPWLGVSTKKIYQYVVVQKKKPPQLSKLPLSASSLKQFVIKCFEFNPAHRPTATQLLAFIETEGQPFFTAQPSDHSNESDPAKIRQALDRIESRLENQDRKNRLAFDGE